MDSFSPDITLHSDNEFFLILDLETGLIIDADDAVFALSGWQAEHVLSRHYSGLIHPEDLDGVEAALSLLSDQGYGRWAGRLKLAGDHYRHCDFRARCGRDGKLAYVTGRDALLDQTLTERYWRLQRLCDLTHDYFIVADHAGNLVWLNQAASELYGVGVDEARGEAIGQFIAESGRAISDEMAGRILNGESIEPYVLAVLDKDGAEVMVECQTEFDAQTQSWYIVERHVSDRIERERLIEDSVRQLSRARAQLQIEKRVAEDARDLAEAAATTRSQFLANMSHEIRTPMNGVIGMASLLADTSLNAEQQAFCNTIRASGESLLAIINEILDFSKIDAGQLELDEHPFDIEDCVVEAMDVVAMQACNKGLELIFDYVPAGPLTVRGDSQRLRQILINLLSNAVKFTHDGDVVVRVEQDPTAHDVLWFNVTDDGIGLKPNQIEHLFDPFTQADASTTRRYGGTGLGLSICRSLVERMGGAISVTSTLGVGSSFRFSVRLPSKPGTTDLNLAPLDKLRVLAVDDNETNRRVLLGMLTEAGMVAEIVDTPDKAQDLLASKPFDLIVSDMSMPDMDGVDMLKAMIASNEAVPPAVLLTSLDRVGIDWSQFSGVLRKPIRSRDLYQTLLEVVEGGDKGNQKAAESASASHDRQAQRVLVAEDNAVNQKVARKMLEKLGYEVDIAADGMQAIERLHAQTYRLVFMDVQMPRLDGIEVTRRVRAEFNAQPHIIAMTANALAEDRSACLSAGMNDFIAKPVRLDDVRAALERAGERFTD